MKTPRLIAIALAILLVLAGCGKRETDVEAGIRTQTLLVGNGGEPESLDPHLQNSIPEGSISNALFEGLTTLDPTTLEPNPAAATSWAVSADGLVYTFHLRPEARWSNGEPVTAYDFAFAFQRILKPECAAIGAFLLWPIRNAKAFNTGQLTDASALGIEVIDHHTLRLTLERPTVSLLVRISQPPWFPVHRATLEKVAATDARVGAWTRPGRLVGNGPFVLTEWQSHSRVVVSKNPTYWNAPRTRLERIVFFPFASPPVEEHAFRAGQLHVTYDVPPSKIKHYRERETAVYRQDPILGSVYLLFNTTQPPFDNAKVRRALAMAIDRPALVNAVYYGSRVPAAAITPPGMLGYNARAAMPYDPAEARRLLAEAGFPAGRGMPGIELQAGQTIEQPRLAEVLQEMWRRELSLRVIIAVAEGKTIAENFKLRRFSVRIFYWAADFVDPANFLEAFTTDGRNKYTGWSHPEYDRLINAAGDLPDPVRRLELFQQAEALLLEQAPAAPLFFDRWPRLVHPSVKGWNPSALDLQHWQDVWLEK